MDFHFQIGTNQHKLNRNLLNNTIIPALEELGKSDFAHVWDYKENHAPTRGRPLESVSFSAAFFKSKQEKDWYVAKFFPAVSE